MGGHVHGCVVVDMNRDVRSRQVGYVATRQVVVVAIECAIAVQVTGRLVDSDIESVS